MEKNLKETEKLKELDLFAYRCCDLCCSTILREKGENELLNLLFEISSRVVKIEEQIRLETRVRIPQYIVNGKEIYTFFEFDNHAYFNELEKKVETNIKVVVFVDIYNFDYHPLFQKSHFLHAIIVDKIENNRVHISDNYTFWQYEGWIDRSLFKNAMEIDNLGVTYNTKFPKACFAVLNSNSLELNWKKLVQEFMHNYLFIPNDLPACDVFYTFIKNIKKYINTNAVDAIYWHNIANDIFNYLLEFRGIVIYLHWWSSIDNDTELKELFSCSWGLEKEINNLRIMCVKAQYSSKNDYRLQNKKIDGIIKQIESFNNKMMVIWKKGDEK